MTQQQYLSEIGLLTLSEFLELRNPKNIQHPTNAYDFSLEDLNKARVEIVGSFMTGRSIVGKLFTYKASEFNPIDLQNAKFTISVALDVDTSRLCAVFIQGNLYFKDFKTRQLLLDSEIQVRERYISFKTLVLNTIRVKNLDTYAKKVFNIVAENEAQYNYEIDRFSIGDEVFTIRSEGPPKAGTTIRIFNSQGLGVASVQDELGATLTIVAKEYRGLGLSQKLLPLWFRYSPAYGSGGFTPQGKAAAISVWANRVRELQRLGFYAAAIENGDLTTERVQSILHSLPRQTPATQKSQRLPPAIEKISINPDTIALYANPDVATFILYDTRFFELFNPQHILGYGHLAHNANVGDFYYALDYDEQLKDIVQRIAFQFAKDCGVSALFDNSRDMDYYSDFLGEVEFPITREGTYIILDQNYIDYQRELERSLHFLNKKEDPYAEKETLLLESAAAKS